MKRYQVYLNSNSISVLDEFGKLSNISRSEIIRSVIDRVVDQLTIVVADSRKASKTYFLDSLAGIIDLKTDKKTHFADNIDEIYQEV